MDLLQEQLTMFNIDVKSKGITWVDNMYQKIESLCMDVDKNLTLQETTKYVENQVQTVGINVRRFCAEVVQDLLPPPLENPVKGPISDLSLTHEDDIGTCYKSKMSLKESPPLNKKSLPPAKMEGNVAVANDLAFPSPAYKSLEKNQDVCDKLSKNPNPVEHEVTGHGFEDREEKVVCKYAKESMPALFDPSTEVIVSFRALETMTPAEISDNGIEHRGESAVLDNILPLEETGLAGSVDDLEGEEAMEFEEIELGSKAIEQCQEKESRRVHSEAFCVISFPTGRTKSFKKKLKEAFTTKLRSPKQKDLEELAYWYEDVDMETKLRGVSPSSSIIREPGTETILIRDLSESDWELL